MNPILSAAPRVLRLAQNTKGRDFIVGDIHGAFTTLLAAMKAANFDGSCDRILSVGDLIDRGVDSWRCAKFLRQPYVEAVRGNHEDMLLELYKDGVPDEAILLCAARQNGFGWWLAVPEEQRMEIVQVIRELPTVIELETSRGLVGLVHADVPAGMSWSEFVREIEAENDDVIQTALWGRDRVSSGNSDGIEGVGRVFVGHTPQWDGLQKYGNLYNVDTGAIFKEIGRKDAGRLTFAAATCQTVVLTAPKATCLFDVREDPPDFRAPDEHPFGSYTAAAREAA